MGRITKLTPEVQDNIVKYIENGGYAKDAVLAVGIDEGTYYNWIKRGSKGEEPYFKFFKSIKKARAKAIMKNVLTIQIAAQTQWQAAAWWLERTSPADWGKKDSLKVESKMEFEDENTKKFLEEHSKLTPEQQERFIEMTIDFEKSVREDNNGTNKD